MQEKLNIQDILTKVKQLDKEEQLNLLERLVLIISKQKDSKNPVRLSSISGIGADIWANTDIDQYLSAEREW